MTHAERCAGNDAKGPCARALPGNKAKTPELCPSTHPNPHHRHRASLQHSHHRCTHNGVQKRNGARRWRCRAHRFRTAANARVQVAGIRAIPVAHCAELGYLHVAAVRCLRIHGPSVARCMPLVERRRESRVINCLEADGAVAGMVRKLRR